MQEQQRGAVLRPHFGVAEPFAELRGLGERALGWGQALRAEADVQLVRAERADVGHRRLHLRRVKHDKDVAALPHVRLGAVVNHVVQDSPVPAVTVRLLDNAIR